MNFSAFPDQIDENLAQATGVSDDALRKLRRDVTPDLEILRVSLRREKSGDALDELQEGELDTLELHPRRFQLREVQDVVDDLEKVFRRSA